MKSITNRIKLFFVLMFCEIVEDTEYNSITIFNGKPLTFRVVKYYGRHGLTTIIV